MEDACMNNKKGLFKLISLVCVIVMLLAVVALPASAIGTYRTAANGASSSYRDGKYYDYLMRVSLTGDGVTDTLAVALSQMGYAESNNYYQLSGTIAGSSNYTEFNYNFGDVLGNNSKYEWSASFCSWVLWQAGVTPDGHADFDTAMCRYHLYDNSNYYWREIACDNWALKLKNMGMYNNRGSYVPEAGDLIFFNRSGTIGHMGFVVWCNGSTVYTVEGNSSSMSGSDGNGGGTYYRSYDLNDTSINGYGKLPYEKNADALKVDYTGQNKTAGLYMANADFWVSAPVNSANAYKDVYKIAKYEMFKVTGFDGQYAIIEHGNGRYYGNLNSNNIQISAAAHQHVYVAGSDDDNHYQICSGCEDKQNIAEHSYTLQYDDANHFEKCSCGHTKDEVQHTLNYVVEDETHKLECSCGYVQDGSHVSHEFDILDRNENEHYYRCECGKIDETSVEEHEFVQSYDENDHFEMCETCQMIIESSVAPHKYDISTSFDSCECGYDRSSLETQHVWEIGFDGENHFHKCSECGEIREETTSAHVFSEYLVDGDYHYSKCACGMVANDTKHTHVYDRMGFVDEENSQVHLKACVCGVLLEGTEEAHYYDELNYDENGHWFECICGFKSEISAHDLQNGTCTECSYHTHWYCHDNNGHWLTCDCDGSGKLEEHEITDGRCEVCGYETTPIHKHSLSEGTCSECGYHEHKIAFDEKGHWFACGCYDGSNALCEHVMEQGKCTECGYVKAQKVLHRIDEQGNCTDCGYHEHIYLYDANGHKNVCKCYLSGRIDRHTLEDGKCTVCGYNSKAGADTGDGTVNELQKEENTTNIGASNGGCGSTLGAASVAMGVILMLGCAVTIKKKEG